MALSCFSICFSPPADNPHDSIPDDHLRGSLIQYDYNELLIGTENFSVQNRIGEGGFGYVYRATIRGDVYALKRLKSSAKQGQKEWLNEIKTLGNLQHDNLVKLYGFCPSEGILVYEFIERGSLDSFLFGEAADSAPLPWLTRIKIASQVSAALTFLHSKDVIHRDLKAPNILLDENWNAKLADFGIAKAVGADKTHASTAIMGTMGYLDPQYMETGQLSKASDVYSFGVLLLELITGRAAATRNGRGVQFLSVWAASKFDSRDYNILDVVDERISSQIDGQAAKTKVRKLAMTARHCLDYERKRRPLMEDVYETIRRLGGL